MKAVDYIVVKNWLFFWIQHPVAIQSGHGSDHVMFFQLKSCTLLHILLFEKVSTEMFYRLSNSTTQAKINLPVFRN